MNTDKKITPACRQAGMNTDKGQALRRSLSRAKSRDSGQAAVELAIFASLILLVLGVFVKYGISANYSQKLKMDAYQKARAAMSGAAQKTTYIILRDKPTPDPSDPFGVASRDSVFVSSETMGRLKGIFDSPDYPSDGSELLSSPQLPRLIYDINGKIYKFTTGAFKYCQYYGQELKRKDYHDDGTWYWRTSGSSRTEGGVDYEHDDAMEADGDFWAELAEDNAQGKQADVDGDDEEELVLKVGAAAAANTSSNDSNSNFGWDIGLADNDLTEPPDTGDIEIIPIDVNDNTNYAVTGFYVLDYQEGQINTGYEGPNGQRQGLQSPSQKNLALVDCSIRRQEDNSQIKSTTKANWQQDITRYIVVNPIYINRAGLTVGNNILPGLALKYKDINGDGWGAWYVDIRSDFSGNKTLQWSATHAN